MCNGGNEINETRKLLKKSFFKNNKKWFWICLVLRLTMTTADIVLSYSMMTIIDTALEGNMTEFAKIVLFCAVTFLLSTISNYLKRPAYAKFIQIANSNYKNAVFSKLMDKSIGAFRNDSASKYISALTNDIAVMENGYFEKIFMTIAVTIEMIVAFVIMIYYNVPLTIVSMLLMIMPLMVSLRSGKKLAENEKTISIENENFIATIKDLLGGFTILKSFKIEDHAKKQFSQTNDRVENAKYIRRMMTQTMDMMDLFAHTLAQYGIFVVGSIMVIRGTGVTVGIVMMFMQMMNYFLNPAYILPPVIASHKAMNNLIDKIAAALCEEDNMDGKYDWDKPLKDGINIENLTFAYNNRESNVIDGISVKFEKGKSYALVGSTGCGKSTMLNLLMGSLDGYSGKISIDGQDVTDISAKSFYDRISLVQQNVFLFNDTIRNNITLYRSCSDDELRIAIRKSGLDDLVSKYGLDYICGEDGKNLSGGEKQRISIARCLLYKTDILMLDEATSALDRVTAANVFNAVLNSNDITRIVVTHQLDEEILKRFDEIVVMKKGKIIEHDKFEKLMDKKGYFYSLYTIESEQTEDNGANNLKTAS